MKKGRPTREPTGHVEARTENIEKAVPDPRCLGRGIQRYCARSTCVHVDADMNTDADGINTHNISFICLSVLIKKLTFNIHIPIKIDIEITRDK